MNVLTSGLIDGVVELPSLISKFHKSGSAGASSSGVPVNEQASSAAQPTGASRRAIAELVVRAVDLDK